MLLKISSKKLMRHCIKGNYLLVSVGCINTKINVPCRVENEKLVLSKHGYIVKISHRNSLHKKIINTVILLRPDKVKAITKEEYEAYSKVPLELPPYLKEFQL